MPKIFISYRREDSQHQADRLHAALKKHVVSPKRDIFIDIDNIPVGVDFRQHLDAKVAECDLLLALIGPDWLKAGAGLPGGRRLDDPKDFVRIEIASALKRGIRVAPVLLDGATMPKESELPDDLKPLAVRNAAEIRRNTFDTDAERMIRGLNLKKIGAKPAPSRPQSGGGSWVAPVVFLALLALAGGGAAVWIIDPFGWKGGVREAGAESSTAAGGPGSTTPGGAPEGTATAADGVTTAAPPPTTSQPPQQAPASSPAAAPSSPAPAPAVDPAAVTTAKAALEQAQADLAFADSQQKRTQSLFDKGVTSQASLDKANADLQAAKTAVADREKDVQRATGAAAVKPATSARKSGETFRDCSDCPEMVVIPAGSFMMGSPATEKFRFAKEGPQRRVTVPAFAAGKYEVMNAEYGRCYTAGACTVVDRINEGDPLPVRGVSWNEANAYTQWLSRKTGHTYRLLSEAEWEYAARAGTATTYFFGDTISPTQANYDNVVGKTTPVGKYPPNAFGLYDMHGNVWEWVEDCHEESYSRGQPSNGRAYTSGPCEFRVARGGSWRSGPIDVRSAMRDRIEPGGQPDYLGFRVARTLP